MMIEFKVGGPVNYQSTCYVERQIEKRIFRAVDKGDFVTIVAPRQVGKTTILQKIQAVKSHQGHATALLDMSTMNPSRTTFERWSISFNTLLQNCLSDYISADIQILPPKGSGQFIEYWEQLATKVNAAKILILMDEASSVPENVRNVFYSTIRWIFTDRTAFNASKNLRKLNFVFAGVFEPERLIKDEENSPFNISKIFRLPDFSKKESNKLFQLIEQELDIEFPDLVTDSVYKIINGHPYYSQSVASALYDEVQGYPNMKLNAKVINDIIAQGVEDASDNINHIGNTVLKYRDQFIKESNSTNSFQKFIIDSLLLNITVPFTRALPQITRLELLGVITQDDNDNCSFRNFIVESTFKKLINLEMSPVPEEVIAPPSSSAEVVGEQLTESVSRIKKLIARNKISTALSELESVLLALLQGLFSEVEEFRNEIIQLKRRYNSITSKKNNGLISSDQADKELNNITNAIISFLDSVNED